MLVYRFCTFYNKGNCN